MNIKIIYFSATGVTKEVAEILQQNFEELGNKTETLNILLPQDRKNAITVSKDDRFVFGFPVYASSIPKIVKTWLEQLFGFQNPCGLYLTYGARAVGQSHTDASSLLKTQGFKVVLSAEFVGRHSFNIGRGFQVVPTRPNEEDLQVARRYARELVERFSNPEVPAIPLSIRLGPENDVDRSVTMDFDHQNLNPRRTTESCQMCNLCESECPTLAFNALSGTTDPQKCIHCMHCTYLCPDKVITTGDLSGFYDWFVRRFKLTDENMELKRSQIRYEIPQFGN